MQLFDFRPGASPLVVSMPHVGTYVPEAIAARLTPHALTLPDTDWHLPRLYDFLGALDATVLVATHSRYVIDLNRPPDNANLYPGQDTTALVPIDTSEKAPVYAGPVPSADEIAARRASYWQPYHERLGAALAAIKARHGYALLWEAHSIKSELPRFFAGMLPVINIGTADGRACGAGLGRELLAIAVRSPYSSVLDGRFKGGYITRAFGAPAERVHAVQLELARRAYMDETHPYAFRDDLAAGIRPVLRALLEAMLDWGRRAG
jgi:N-formylglutamate deformylase